MAIRTNGPGKYDIACTAARMSTAARGVILMVVGGFYGDGFSVQMSELDLRATPGILRDIADDIDRQIKESDAAGRPS